MGQGCGQNALEMKESLASCIIQLPGEMTQIFKNTEMTKLYKENTCFGTLK